MRLSLIFVMFFTWPRVNVATCWYQTRSVKYNSKKVAKLLLSVCYRIFTSRLLLHYFYELTKSLWATVYVPFKLQLRSSSRDECVVPSQIEFVCVRTCAFVRLSTLMSCFVFAKVEDRDGIWSIYLESGITGHCLLCKLMQADGGRDGRSQSRFHRRMCVENIALSVVSAGSFVAKCHVKWIKCFQKKGNLS